MNLERLQPAAQGVDLVASPEYIAVQRAQSVENLLVGRDGKLLVRGPLTFTYDVNQPAPAAAGGYMAYGDQVIVRRTDTELLHIDLNSGGAVGTSVAIPDNSYQPGSSYTRNGARVFSVNRFAGAYTGVGELLRWDGGAVAGSKLPQAPKDSAAVCSHLSRLFALGGSVPGTATPIYPNRLYWTDSDTTLGMETTANWSDPVSGLVNQIVLDGDEGDVGVQLARLGRSLCILRSQSLSMLYGDRPSAFSVRSVGQAGCVAAASVVPMQEGLFFMSPEGFMYFDGSALTNVSRRIWPAISGTVLNPGAIVRCARWGSDHIAVLAGETYLLHIPSGSWSKMTLGTALTGSSALGLVGSTPNHAFVWTGNRIFDATAVPQPEVAATARTIPGGSTPGPYAVDGVVGVKAAIPARWNSRVARLATPTNRATMNRVLVDYTFRGAQDAGEQAWSVILRNAADDSSIPGATFTLPTSLQGTRQRVAFDCYAEVTELYVTVEWTGSSEASVAGKPVNPEIYDVWLEYQPARQK